MQPDFPPTRIGWAQGPTHAHRLVRAFSLFADRPALRWKEGGAWREMTYAALAAQVWALAALLHKKGIGPGERVSIWHETSWSWLVADFAVQIVGAVTVPIYHSLSKEEAAYILKDCGAKAIFIGHKRLLEIPPEIGDALLKIAVDRPDDWSRALDEGNKELEAHPSLRQVLEDPSVKPEDVSAIIYTSGTTGVPKGAVLTHKNVAGSCLDALIERFLEGTVHVMLLHLPLAHIMARNVSAPVILYSGGVLAIAEPQRERLPENLKEVRPTTFVTVPYLLDKFMAGVLDKIRGQPLWKRRLTEYAIALGRKRRLAGLSGDIYRPRPLGPVLWLLDRMILRKIRASLGGNLSHLIIGSANSNRESVEFFWGVGIPVYEGYGATEITNAAAYTSPEAIRLGTVGKACPGVEIRLAEDGEVLVRGPNVMKGYWNLPEATAEALDAEGWYHTGDLGRMEDGFLKIIDRKKEIYVLATGKNVAPQGVENALKRSSLILQSFVAGDRRNYVTALLVPDLSGIQKALGLNETPAVDDRRVRDLVQQEIARVSASLSDYERPKRFALVGEPFSIENGLLTPTLKLKRKAILQRYARDIESLYGGSS